MEMFKAEQKIKLGVDLKVDDKNTISKGTEGIIKSLINVRSNEQSPCSSFLVEFPEGFVVRVSSEEMEAVRRASSPNDSLYHSPTTTKYPDSKYKMYQKVHITDNGYDSWVNRLKKNHEKVLRRMRKKGSKGVSFKHFYLNNEHDVSSPLYIANPERVGEIVGMHCVHGQVLTMVSNECYLNRGSCHSGVTYAYDILIRKTDKEGRAICYIATNFFDSCLESYSDKDL
jgi:hypothetical protein